MEANRGIEKVLFERAVDFMRKSMGIRRNRVVDLFRRIAYISPDNLIVTNYPRRKPLVAFNPGAVLVGDILQVFPRLVFDYYWYISSIGFFEVSLSRLESSENTLVDKEISTRIILWPSVNWDLVGCEDPRVTLLDGKYHVLYTARAITSIDGKYKPLQGYAVLSKDLRILEKKYFRIKSSSGEYIPPSWKDSAFLDVKNNEATMLTRPSIPFHGTLLEIGWWGIVNLREGVVDLDSLKPVLSLEKWELKIGWSTNTVRISSNEYLVGWHGVGEDYVYRNGLAVVSPDGELLGITDYVLEPKGLAEYYGDRPGVIFGDGLVLRGEYIYWIGGVSDYAIGVFRAKLEDILSHVKWLKG